MRVKLLEAFAAGIPVVSTRLGAEGLTDERWRHLRAGGRPVRFADKILELFADAGMARNMASRARERVAATRDMPVLTERLVESYRAVLRSKRG